MKLATISSGMDQLEGIGASFTVTIEEVPGPDCG
jgi:hypothetical protein